MSRPSIEQAFGAEWLAVGPIEGMAGCAAVGRNLALTTVGASNEEAFRRFVREAGSGKRDHVTHAELILWWTYDEFFKPADPDTSDTLWLPAPPTGFLAFVSPTPIPRRLFRGLRLTEAGACSRSPTRA